jgi:hypothetical protein
MRNGFCRCGSGVRGSGAADRGFAGGGGAETGQCTVDTTLGRASVVMSRYVQVAADRIAPLQNATTVLIGITVASGGPSGVLPCDACIAPAERADSLGGHPKIWPDSINVFVTGLGESSINIDVMCWFATTSWDEFQQIRSDVYLDLIGIVRACGSDFAFPTRTLEFSADATQALLSGSMDAERGGPDATRRERPS